MTLRILLSAILVTTLLTGCGGSDPEFLDLAVRAFRL